MASEKPLTYTTENDNGKTQCTKVCANSIFGSSDTFPNSDNNGPTYASESKTVDAR